MWEDATTAPQKLKPNQLSYLLEELTLAVGCIPLGLGYEQTIEDLNHPNRLPLFAVYPRDELSAFVHAKNLLHRFAKNQMPRIFEFIWLGLDICQVDHPAHHCRAFFIKDEVVKALVQTKNKHVIFFSSVGKAYHEDHYLEASIDLFIKIIAGCVETIKQEASLNQTFSPAQIENAKSPWRITVIAADTLQAYNEADFDAQKEKIHAKHREKGELWIEKAKPVFERLKMAGEGIIDVKISYFHWDTLLKSAKDNYCFDMQYQYLKEIYSDPETSLESKSFVQSVNDVGFKYLMRQEKKKQVQMQIKSTEIIVNHTSVDYCANTRLVGLSDSKIARSSVHLAKQILIVQSMMSNIKYYFNTKTHNKTQNKMPSKNSSGLNPPAINESYCIRRQELLKELEQYFTTTSDLTQQTLIAACEGNGGVGKTHLAAYFASHTSPSYTMIPWIRADTITVNPPSNLAISFKLLGEYLNLINDNMGPEEIRKRVIYYLENHPGWLLVLDNVDDHNIIKDYIPKKGGHVILTSRQKKSDRNIKAIEVDIMSEEEAVELLVKISGRTEQRNELVLLAKKLGNLPLALELAAAFLKKYPDITIVQYINKYDTNCLEVMSDKSLIITQVSTKTVAATFYASLHQIRDEYKKTDKIKMNIMMLIIEEFLNVCAYLASVKIPISLLLYWIVERYPSCVKEDKNILWDILSQLAEHSLIKWEIRQGLFSIHPVLQDVLRTKHQASDKLENPDTRKRWIDNILKSFITTINKTAKDDIKNKYLLSHLQMLLRHFSSLNELEIQSELKYAIALMQIKFGTPREAIQTTEQAWQLRKTLQVNNHLDIVILATELAYAYSMNNLYASAQNILEECVMSLFSPHYEICGKGEQNSYSNNRTKKIVLLVETLSGFESYDLVYIKLLECLIAVYLKLKFVEEGKRLLIKILAIKEIHYGKESYEYLRSFIYMAKFYAAQGENDLQKKQVLSAFGIFANIYKFDHLKNVDLLSIFADAFFDLDEYDIAKQFLLLVKKTLEWLSVDMVIDIKYAIIIRRLAKLQLLTQEQVSNLFELETALQSIENFYGEIHSETISALMIFSLSLFANGDLERAITNLEIACARIEQYYGCRNLSVAQAMLYLADLYSRAGNYERMKSLVEEVLEIAKIIDDKHRLNIDEVKMRLTFANDMLSHHASSRKLIDDIYKASSPKLTKQCLYFKPAEKELVHEFSAQLRLNGFSVKIKSDDTQTNVLKINLSKSFI